MNRALICGGLSLVVSLSTRRASCEEANVTPVANVAALGEVTAGDAAFGFGVRGGATFRERTYLGGIFGFHPTSSDIGAPNWLWYAGAEAGIHASTSPVTRFYVGGGYHQWASSSWSTGGTNIRTAVSGSVLVWPGFALLFPVDPLFMGFDLRFLVAFGPAAPLPVAPCVALTMGGKL
jgi:hypothetical protein